MQFYKPAQGDTAATVAEGYDRNFQHLENSKVDSVDDAGLMTDAEREKLAGIDEGANAYVHPESHSADMITDTAEKVVMTTSEREKLAGIDEEANAYVLPVATAEVLGGIKIGDGLEVAEDGTLSAPGGGSGGNSDELGVQNFIPSGVYLRTGLGDVESMLDADTASLRDVRGSSSVRLSAISPLPFYGRFLTVEQHANPHWQMIVVIQDATNNTPETNTYVLEGNKWPENYPKTYDLGSVKKRKLGFIFRMKSESSVDPYYDGMQDMIERSFTVTRGTRPIGCAEPAFGRQSFPRVETGSIYVNVKEGKITGLNFRSKHNCWEASVKTIAENEIVAYLNLASGAYIESFRTMVYRSDATKDHPAKVETFIAMLPGSNYLSAATLRVIVQGEINGSGFSIRYCYLRVPRD